MADETMPLPNEQNLDYYIVTLFERLENLRKDNGYKTGSTNSRINMHTELRTLTFWRAIISECLASFLYVFIVCGAAAGAGIGVSLSSVILSTSIASGLAVATLTHCFLHISGAHINPAVTLATAFTRLISPLRACMYIMAQCGGAIAGAALLYGVSLPGYESNLQAPINHSSMVKPWERFGVELVLTFVVVFAYFVSTSSYRKFFGSSAAMIGAAYGCCTFVSMPYLNPARSLGPAFVLNKWENHWVFWLGPMFGGAISGILYEIIFKPGRGRKRSKDMDESSSMNSEGDVNYDMEHEKPNTMQPKFHRAPYNSYSAAPGTIDQGHQGQGYCQAMYPPPPSKVERVESIYGGTRSLYCKSPPLTRANLHRSQSVYAKSNTAINRDLGPIRAGPLVPAQSLYPLRVAPANQQQQQNTHLQNQNVQNQMQQRSESIYGIRSSMRQPSSDRMIERMPDRIPASENQGFQPIYGTRNNPTPNESLKYERETREVREVREDPSKYNRNRPDSVYGMTNRRGQSTHSDDSSYGSYHGTNTLTPPNRQMSNGNPNFPQNTQNMMMQGTYGMLPAPSPQQPAQQQQPQQNQKERSMSTSTTASQQNQRVEYSQKPTTNGPSSSINTPPPPPAHQQQYNMHPIRQN